MGRPKKVQTESKVDAIYTMAKELKVDPLMVFCMGLGGSAAALGATPPLTRLFNIVGASAGISQGDASLFVQKYEEWENKKEWWLGGSQWSPNRILLGGLYDLFNPPPEETDTSMDAKKAATFRYMMFCSGALEAAFMYRMTASPEIMKALIGAPAEILKGIGEIVPG